MRIRLARGAAKAAILVVAVVLLVQFVALPANATSYNLNGSAECVALGGVWSIGCTFSSLTVASGDTLTVAPLVSVEITSSLTVDGTLDNQGGILVDNTATVTVNGVLDNEDLFDTYGTVTLTAAGQFSNTGSSPGFTNEAGAYFNILGYFVNSGSGTITNWGAMVVGTSGELVNEAPATISSYGSLTTYGELYNNADFYNGGWLNAAVGGYIYNDGAGTLDNLVVTNITSVLYNFGMLDSYSSSVINLGSGAEAGFLYNDGSIQNAGSYAITASSELENAMDLDNTGGTITNVGLVQNNCQATVENAAGVSPDPVQYIPCAPAIVGISSSTGATGAPSTASTLFGTADIYSGGGNPLIIDLYEGTTLLGSGLTTDAAGDWTITTTPLAAGDNLLFATATDAQGIVSADSATFPVGVIVSTSTAVSCSPTSLDVGTSTMCTATVTELGGGPPTTPTGTVDWSDPGGVFTPPTCTLAWNGVAGQAACATSYVPGSGSEGYPISITGDFVGSEYYTGSTSGTSISSSMLGSDTSFSCSPALVLNAPSTCTATVTDVPGSANIFPGSLVMWTTSGSGAFSGPSVCTLAELTPDSSRCAVIYIPSALGTRTIAASYGGDVDHMGSTRSETLSASKRIDSTTVTCAPNPDPVNAKTTCTVVVKDTSPGTPITPGGTVTFTAGGPGSFSSHTCTLVGGTCSVGFTPAGGSEGTHTVTGTYSGDTDHVSSKGSVALTVVKRSVSVGIACTPPLTKGSKISCTVTVKDISPGTVTTPTGKISVTITPPKGASSTATCTLSGSGATATCKFTFTPGSTGAWSLRAAYPGDGSHLMLSTTVLVTVT